jgi:hypothetical protein
MTHLSERAKFPLQNFPGNRRQSNNFIFYNFEALLDNRVVLGIMVLILPS